MKTTFIIFLLIINSSVFSQESKEQGVKVSFWLSLLVLLILSASCAERKLTYYPDGTTKVKRIKYIGGKTKQINFYNNGKKSSISIQKESYPSTFNTITVKHIKWNEEGNKTLYKKGKKEIEWKYYPSGNLKRKHFKKYFGEKLDFTDHSYELTEYYENGNKKKVESGKVHFTNHNTEKTKTIEKKISWNEEGKKKVIK